MVTEERERLHIKARARLDRQRLSESRSQLIGPPKLFYNKLQRKTVIMELSVDHSKRVYEGLTTAMLWDYAGKCLNKEHVEFICRQFAV